MIVGVSGLAGVGKDTTADRLVEKYNFVKVSLADPLKRICKEVYDFSDEQLWGPSEMRNAPDTRYRRRPPETMSEAVSLDIDAQVLGMKDRGPPFLTPRYALQQLGTEWGRDCYNNTWIDLALRTAKKLSEEGGYVYTARHGLDHVWMRGDGEAAKYSVVIPDVRFKNEVDAIKAAGGKLVRIYRGEAGLHGAAGQHLSETEQNGIPDSVFDHIIDNNGDISLLHRYVDQMMDVLRERIMAFDEAQENIPPFLRAGKGETDIVPCSQCEAPVTVKRGTTIAVHCEKCRTPIAAL